MRALAFNTTGRVPVNPDGLQLQMEPVPGEFFNALVE